MFRARTSDKIGTGKRRGSRFVIMIRKEINEERCGFDVRLK